MVGFAQTAAANGLYYRHAVKQGQVENTTKVPKIVQTLSNLTQVSRHFDSTLGPGELKNVTLGAFWDIGH